MIFKELYCMNKQSNLLEKINEAESSMPVDKCIELCRQAILKPELTDTEELFKIQFKLANLLIDTKNNNFENSEEAIEILKDLFFNPTKSSETEKKAFLNLAFGYAYSKRLKGEKKSNIKKSINYYEQALVFFTKDKRSQEWALTKAGIGKAYSIIEDNELNIIKAIENYLDTLSIYTKEEYPEDYEDSIRELSILKKRLNDNGIWDSLMEKL